LRAKANSTIESDKEDRFSGITNIDPPSQIIPTICGC
jgi:hypothetical protein